MEQDNLNQTEEQVPGAEKEVAQTNSTTESNNGDNSASRMPGNAEDKPEMNCTESENEETTCEPPKPPEGLGDMRMDGGPREDGVFEPTNPVIDPSNGSVLHPVAYLSLGAGSVILSTIVIYACFSNLFHKKPGQTFSTLPKFALFVVATIGLSGILISLCYFIPTWTS